MPRGHLRQNGTELCSGLGPSRCLGGLRRTPGQPTVRAPALALAFPALTICLVNAALPPSPVLRAPDLVEAFAHLGGLSSPQLLACRVPIGVAGLGSSLFCLQVCDQRLSSLL